MWRLTVLKKQLQTAKKGRCPPPPPGEVVVVGGPLTVKNRLGTTFRKGSHMGSLDI
jgi:hypothetical protein